MRRYFALIRTLSYISACLLVKLSDKSVTVNCYQTKTGKFEALVWCTFYRLPVVWAAAFKFAADWFFCPETSRATMQPDKKTSADCKQTFFLSHTHITVTRELIFAHARTWRTMWGLDINWISTTVYEGTLSICMTTNGSSTTSTQKNRIMNVIFLATHASSIEHTQRKQVKTFVRWKCR